VRDFVVVIIVVIVVVVVVVIVIIIASRVLGLFCKSAAVVVAAED